MSCLSDGKENRVAPADRGLAPEGDHPHNGACGTGPLWRGALALLGSRHVMSDRIG